MSVATDGLPPCISAPSDESFSGAIGSNGGSNIEIEYGLACGLRLSGVVVDYISDFLLLAVDLS